MASDKKETPKEGKKGYQPKATARHAKITKTKKEEIEILKKKIETDRHLAKKYESGRKTEIKALPKEDRAAAKAELRESIAKRKEAEEKDREKLRAMVYEERMERTDAEKEPFDEEAWLKGGRKKGRGKETPDVRTAADTAPEPENTEDPEKED